MERPRRYTYLALRPWNTIRRLATSRHRVPPGRRARGLQGLYGNYILLFPQQALDNGVVLAALNDLWLRYDCISVADTPPVDPSIRADATAPAEPFIIVGPAVARVGRVRTAPCLPCTV
jgi:hypothetical protein